MANLIDKYVKENDRGSFVHLDYIQYINIGQNVFALLPSKEDLRIRIDENSTLVEVVRVRPIEKVTGDTIDPFDYFNHKHYDILDGVLYEYHTDGEGNLIVDYYDSEGIDGIAFKEGYSD